MTRKVIRDSKDLAKVLRETNLNVDRRYTPYEWACMAAVKLTLFVHDEVPVTDEEAFDIVRKMYHIEDPHWIGFATEEDKEFGKCVLLHRNDFLAIAVDIGKADLLDNLDYMNCCCETVLDLSSCLFRDLLPQNQKYTHIILSGIDIL